MSGPPKILTDNEEEELEKFLYDCAQIGYGKTRSDVTNLVNRYLLSRGVDKPVSYGWWASFRKRHPNVVLRAPASLARSRYLATNPVMLDRYFDLLQKCISELKLEDKPGQIFNVDESGMPLNPKPPKVLNQRGVKNPSSLGKAQITTVCCVSASGVCVPPMVIWDRKTLSPELAKGEIPGTIYGLSATGWMDMELYEIWFKKHFLRHAPAARPLLLLMDGHSSHYCIDSINLARREEITLFVLPPNTTHLTQPLDKGVFGPLKVKWREVCYQYLSANPGRVVTRFEFSKLFADAWLNTMTIRNIVSSFSTTGVFPVNKNAIDLPVSSPVPEHHPKSIPSYTPAKSCPPRTMIKLYNPRLSDDSLNSESDDSQERFATTYKAAEHKSSLSKFLEYPSPPPRKAGISEEKFARVLTSNEHVQAMEEKQRKKEEEKIAKEKRAEERRAKKELKDKEKAFRKKGLSYEKLMQNS